MAKERLLKRIRLWSQDNDDDTSDTDLVGYTQSLLDDIGKIYNTRKGTVMLDSEFGVPDFTSLMTSMLPPEIEKLTRDFITVTNQYEPRLKSVNIQYKPREDDMGLIRFSVNGKVDYRESLAPVSFDILLQGDGSVILQVQE